MEASCENYDRVSVELNLKKRPVVSRMKKRGNLTVSSAGFILNNMSKRNNAMLVFDYFREKIDPVKHVILYNVMMKLFRESKEFEKAEKLFDEMLQRRVKPNVITFSTMINCAALCSMHHKAVEWFEMMPLFECEQDGKFLLSMIILYARIGNVDVALRFYDRAKKEKWDVDIVAFTAMIKMYGKLGNYDGCLRVYNDMKVLGVKPNLVTYNNMLHAMGKGKMAWKAKAIYEEMINDGIPPNQSIYGAVLHAYCRGRYKKDALSVYKEMKENGMDVDRVLYNMLLDMCADFGYVDEAVEIFKDMKCSGTCHPCSVTYTSMINMYSCAGKVSEAEAMLNEMIACGFEPNILVLTSLAGCYGKAKRTDDVVRIFNQLLDLGVSPDDRLCVCLLHVMTQIPKQEHGKITDCIEKANPKLGFVVRYLVEEREGGVDFRKEASELFNTIDDYVIKKSLCNSLIDLCVNLEVPDRARELLNLGHTLEIYTDIQIRSQTMWALHVKTLSTGTALTALHVWINDLSKALESGEELPLVLGIHTAKNKSSSSVVQSYLKEHNAPFEKDTDSSWFLTTNEEAKSWLQYKGSSETDAALNSSPGS
ncbi:pentatricopeptide repeat-containing protein At4g16390, chloroplastic-like [Vicia villosa]|uniref:pentatricopeptide repeat-containing protein At4g16390, chloroplastic-like n=1 Tax=Vicia villosa TaxID=3911 RepID=UPI00273CEDE5|nr:pentatricopeptide repeat-containing protein At4g16390, chloroplastic-like [Vicia villosa]